MLLRCLFHSSIFRFRRRSLVANSNIPNRGQNSSKLGRIPFAFEIRERTLSSIRAVSGWPKNEIEESSEQPLHESDWTAGLISLCDCQLFHLVTSPQTTPARTCIRRSMHAVGDRFTSKLCRPLRFPSPAKVAWGLRGTRIPCCRPRKVRGQSRRTVPPPEGPRHRRARAIHSWLPTRGSSSRRRRA